MSDTFILAIFLILVMFGIAIRDERAMQRLSASQAAEARIQNHQSSIKFDPRWNIQKFAILVLLLIGSYSIAKRSCISAFTKPQLSANIVCGTSVSITAGLTLYGMIDGLLLDRNRGNT